MRSTATASPLALLFSVFLITFVSAIPAAAAAAANSPDKYIHFHTPGYPNTRRVSCLAIPYCKYHKAQGDLFNTKYLNRQDGAPPPEPENLDFNLTTSSLPFSSTITRGSDVVLSKRFVLYRCGLLLSRLNLDASTEFGSLIAGVLYDFIFDYPYAGATGGMIGLFARVIINGAAHVICVGQARTGFGGTRFSFHAPQNVLWFQVIFAGDDPATAAIQYYIGRND